MKETTTKLVDKKLIALEDENWGRFVQAYIVTELSGNLGHRLMDILKNEKEITVRLSDVRVEESVIDQGIEYRQMMDWNPLIRCKDCKWFGKVGCAVMIADDYDKPTENDYCSYGVAKGEGDD